MKRTMKKVFALALAVMLVMALTVSAFAGEPTEYNGIYKITIETTVPNPGTFSAYQVFKGDLAEDSDGELILSNVQWGVNINGGTALTALKEINEFAGCTDAASVAKVLDAYTDNVDVVQKFAEVIEGALLESPAASSNTITESDGKKYVELNVATTGAGYYLVKSTAPSAPNDTNNYAETRYILEVVGEAKVTEKASVPSVEKKVLDANDSNATDPTNTWGDTADYDIGDHVPFTLTGTLPSNYADYEKYTYVFHDTLSEGLTYDDNAKVFVVNGENESEVTGKFTVTHDGTTLTISIDDLTDISTETTIDKDSKIVVRYTATLNKDAVIGNLGNPNEVYLEFSNNPNADGEGDTGTTPHDTVVVFTYQLDVDKVNENNEPLEGAGFTLSKLVKNAEGEDVYQPIAFKPVEKTLPDGSKQTIYVVASTGGNTEISGEKITSFPFGGLDDGEYMLEETTTPPGYNTIKPVYFSITAEHNNTDQLKSVVFTVDKDNTDDEDATITSGTEADGNLGIGSIDIVNNKGTQLPSTGGMGTTILYIVGGVLAVGAAVILVVRKRMQSRQQSNQ